MCTFFLDAARATLAAAISKDITLELIVQVSKVLYALGDTLIKIDLLQKHLENYENAQFLDEGLKFDRKTQYLNPMIAR